MESSESIRSIISCPHCLKTFTEKRSMLRHVKKLHKYRCQECTKGFTREEEWKEHTCTKRQCLNCRQVIDNLEDHRETCKALQCQTCKKRFNNLSWLLKHKKSCMKVRKCRYCNQTFNNEEWKNHECLEKRHTIETPDYIKASHCIHALSTDSHGIAYQDRNCVVRALAFHRLSNNNQNTSSPPDYVTDNALKQLTNEYAEQWEENGVELNKINQFEDMFDIDVDIFSLQKDGTVIPIYMTAGRRKQNRITLNLSDEHLSYVSNLKAYLIKFMCDGCDQIFTKFSDLKRHRGTCTRASLKKFSYDHYKPTTTIFEKLENERIIVSKEERFYKWFATFDCECILIDQAPQTGGTQWTKEHRLVSMSICSNVYEYREPKCFLGKDPYLIVNDAVIYLKEIGNKVNREARNKWHYVIDTLKKRIDQRRQNEKTRKKDNKEERDTVLPRLERMLEYFNEYCRTLPVIGFNSASYDMNVLKTYLFPAIGFGVEEDEPKRSNYYVIKKNKSYSSVCGNGLKFLDITNFQAPGLSYARFLKAYGVKETKSFFAYEWMDSTDKLDYHSLPPYEAFYSTLKGLNVLEEKDDDEDESEEKRRVRGLERYKELKQIWQEKGWSCIAHYLEYYNNLDVGPFVEALEKLQIFYFTKGVDVFKSAISIPGIARHMLFDSARKQQTSFSSILGMDEDLYYVIKRNIVGGPSIIFHRDHGVGRTFLYGNKNLPCMKIVGYDANALYLWAIDQNMPCGGYIRRVAPLFKPEFRLYGRDMYDWMDFMAMITKRTIWHERNHGEVYVDKYKLDGYCAETNTAYEFDGCYYHGCEECQSESKPIVMKERRMQTEEKRRVVEKVLGTKVIAIKECHYKAWVEEERCRIRVKDLPNLYDFTESRLPAFYQRHRYGPRPEQCIMNSVRSGQLYGMLEVDIHVPEELYERFSEMSPLFCTVDISMDDIGDHMQDYVKETNMSTKPRHLLVGGMKAERVLLHTDLLKWYLEKGLVVTKLHQVIEFHPERVFQAFVKEITEARRGGDVDPSMKPKADASKLIGNSAYGSLIMDKEKHQDTKYVTDNVRAQRFITNPRFKSLNELSNSLMEITLSKKTVACDLPIQLGYTILQLAKLKMLQFYYDFLQIQCKPQHFQLCEMDTDSCYMALAGPDIESILKPIYKQSFRETVFNTCNDHLYGPDQGHVFPRECCTTHSKYDSRTPGLFKLEAEGVEMTSLCSKTYSLKTEDGKCKFSSKGLNKKALSNPHDVFKEVLETGIPASGTNKGFREHNSTVYTYQQERTAISYFYCKRQVMPDGRSTRPLPVTLKIWPERTLDVVEDHSHPLWPERQFTIKIGETEHPINLIEVCKVAMKMDDPDEVVKQAMEQLPPYDPKGELLFVAIGQFNRKFKKVTGCFRWTTGMTPRAVSRVEAIKYPGLNKLAEIWIAICESRRSPCK